jgi:hypothetical protein
MTDPKVNTIMRGGSRFYVSPEDGHKVPGVTSIVGMLPKGFLKFWAAKSVAEAAVDCLPEVVGLALKAGKASAVDYLKRAPDRDTAQAAENGTAAHDIFETLAKGEDPGRVHPDLQPYADHFREFLSVVKPTIVHTEQTVWSQTHDYAGSFDAFGIIDDLPVWLDWKTTRSGVHEEVAVQLSAYANAEFIIAADGTKTDMPKGDAGAVLHVRPEGWKLVPVNIGPAVFDVFLALRRVFTWDHEGKRSVLGPAAYSGPSEATPEKVKPSARIAAARRKATA